MWRKNVRNFNEKMGSLPVQAGKSSPSMTSTDANRTLQLMGNGRIQKADAMQNNSQEACQSWEPAASSRKNLIYMFFWTLQSSDSVLGDRK
jgi:hypothetical protein